VKGSQFVFWLPFMRPTSRSNAVFCGASLAFATVIRTTTCCVSRPVVVSSSAGSVQKAV